MSKIIERAKEDDILSTKTLHFLYKYSNPQSFMLCLIGICRKYKNIQKSLYKIKYRSAYMVEGESFIAYFVAEKEKRIITIK